MSFDPLLFRHTMRLWVTGVTIVTTRYQEIMHGMTVSAFSSVTLDPPLILVCMQKSSETAQFVIQSKCMAVSMLGEEQAELSNRFAGLAPLAEGESRFDGVELEFKETGAPILADAMGWLDCRLRTTYDGSTHYIFISEVVAASGEKEPKHLPLLYYNREYRQLG